MMTKAFRSRDRSMKSKAIVNHVFTSETTQITVDSAQPASSLNSTRVDCPLDTAGR